MEVVAALDSVDVILRDGGTLRLRPPRREDGDALVEFHRGLSTESLRSRFHGLPNLRPQLVEPLLEPDWTARGALLGTLADGGGERIVAVGNYVRLTRRHVVAAGEYKTARSRCRAYGSVVSVVSVAICVGAFSGSW